MTCIVCKKIENIFFTSITKIMEQNAKSIEFIAKAQKVHNTKYDYSKVQYEKSTLK